MLRQGPRAGEKTYVDHAHGIVPRFERNAPKQKRGNGNEMMPPTKEYAAVWQLLPPMPIQQILWAEQVEQVQPEMAQDRVGRICR